MITQIQRQRPTLFYRVFSALLAFAFIFSSIIPPQRAQAQVVPALPLSGLNLPAPGSMIAMSPVFNGPMVKGITLHPDDPFKFEFIIDQGDDRLSDEAKRKEYQRLVKYFLASLTVPEDDLWVNLSPHEKDRIIPDQFGLTEMGRDLLAQDYILKQLTASLIYPEDELGQKFWDKVYKKARVLYGHTDIPVDMFNKVWIVPETAVVFEQDNTAYVAESRLKVMLEGDYQEMNKGVGSRVQGLEEKLTPNPQTLNPQLSSQIIRELIVPEIEREVNEGKNFAQLRQIYNSLILAAWYKQSLKQSLLVEIYADKNKIAGVDSKDANAKQKIYDQYMQAFEQGVYNYIKEDYDPVAEEIIPRKYFSGGMGWHLTGVLESGNDLSRFSVRAQENLEEISSSPLDNTVVNLEVTESSSPVEMAATVKTWQLNPLATLTPSAIVVHPISDDLYLDVIKGFEHTLVLMNKNDPGSEKFSAIDNVTTLSSRDGKFDTSIELGDKVVFLGGHCRSCLSQAIIKTAKKSFGSGNEFTAYLPTEQIWTTADLLSLHSHDADTPVTLESILQTLTPQEATPFEYIQEEAEYSPLSIYARDSLDELTIIVRMGEDDSYLYEAKNEKRKIILEFLRPEHIEKLHMTSSPVESSSSFAHLLTQTGKPMLWRDVHPDYKDIETFLKQTLGLTEDQDLLDVIKNVRKTLKEILGLEEVDIFDFPGHEGLEVHVAHLGLQPTNSFKPWITYGGIEAAARNPELDTFIATTTGNQGGGLTWFIGKLNAFYRESLRRFKLKIYVSKKDITFKKLKGMDDSAKAGGVDLEIIGDPRIKNSRRFEDYNAASKAGEAEADQLGHQAHYVHHADEIAILSYVALGEAIVDQYIENGMDLNTAAFIVPVGAGGIAAGVAIAAKLRNPNVKIIVVQTERTKHAYKSFADGKVIEYFDEHSGKYDEGGINTKTMELPALKILFELTDGLVVVHSKDIPETVGYYAKEGIKVEGAAVLAHLAMEEIPDLLRKQGVKHVVNIATGSNISDEEFREDIKAYENSWRAAASSPVDSGSAAYLASRLDPTQATDDIHPYEASADAPWNVNNILYDLARIDFDALTEDSVVAELSSATGITSRLFLDELRRRNIKIKKLVLIEVDFAYWKAAMNSAIRDLYGQYDDVVDEIEFRVLPIVDRVIVMANDALPELVGEVDLLLWENAAHLVGNQLLPILQSNKKLLKPDGQMVVGSGSITREGLSEDDVYIDTPFEFVWQEIIELVETNPDFSEFQTIWQGVSDEEKLEAWRKAFEIQIFPKKPPLDHLESALAEAGFIFETETPRVVLEKDGYEFFVLESKGMTEPATAPFFSIVEQGKNISSFQRKGLPSSAQESADDRIDRIGARIEALDKIERLNEKLAELRRRAYENVWAKRGQLYMAWTSTVSTVASSPVYGEGSMETEMSKLSNNESTNIKKLAKELNLDQEIVLERYLESKTMIGSKGPGPAGLYILYLAKAMRGEDSKATQRKAMWAVYHSGLFTKEAVVVSSVFKLALKGKSIEFTDDEIRMILETLKGARKNMYSFLPSGRYRRPVTDEEFKDILKSVLKRRGPKILIETGFTQEVIEKAVESEASSSPVADDPAKMDSEAMHKYIRDHFSIGQEQNKRILYHSGTAVKTLDLKGTWDIFLWKVQGVILRVHHSSGKVFERIEEGYRLLSDKGIGPNFIASGYISDHFYTAVEQIIGTSLDQYTEETFSESKQKMILRLIQDLIEENITVFDDTELEHIMIDEERAWYVHGGRAQIFNGSKADLAQEYYRNFKRDGKYLFEAFDPNGEILEFLKSKGAQERASSPVTKRTVLIVEDDAFIRQMGKSVISDREGYSVLEAENGAIALDLIERQMEAGERIDLIVTDFNMPVMDGRSLVINLKDRFPNIPIVMRTAVPFKKRNTLSQQLGIQVLSKGTLADWKDIIESYEADLEQADSGGDNAASSPVSLAQASRAVVDHLKDLYKKAGIDRDDYNISPIIPANGQGVLNSGDVLFWFNHRPDRSLAALEALTDPEFNINGKRFDTKPEFEIDFVPFANYDAALLAERGIKHVFTPDAPDIKTVSQLLQEHDVEQGRFSETDKGSHVTSFYDGEELTIEEYARRGIHVVIESSESVDDRDKDPRMKYREIAQNAIDYMEQKKRSGKRQSLLINFPFDIQAHVFSGDKERAVATALFADQALKMVRDKVRELGGVLLVTADHGNGEEIARLDDNGIPLEDEYGVIPSSAHSRTNPVPFIIEGLEDAELNEGLGLASVEATKLDLLGIEAPGKAESILKSYRKREIKGPIVTVIMDGWGENQFKNPEALEWDAIHLAQPPTFNDLKQKNPWTTLKAHGSAVGLPDDQRHIQMGDSDNGHKTMGAAEVVPTLFGKIMAQIDTGEFHTNKLLREKIQKAIDTGGDIGIGGLMSDGGVHSHYKYVEALLELAAEMGVQRSSTKIKLYAGLDGRDVQTRVPVESGVFYLTEIINKAKELGLEEHFIVGAAIGRGIIMDRDAVRRDRLGKHDEAGVLWNARFKKAYDAMVYGVTAEREVASSPVDGAAMIGAVLTADRIQNRFKEDLRLTRHDLGEQTVDVNGTPIKITHPTLNGNDELIDFYRVGEFFIVSDNVYARLGADIRAYPQLIHLKDIHFGYWTPYTLAIIAMMQANRKSFEGIPFIDFGAGNGILGIVAERLGASKVILFERLNHKVEDIKENMRLNEIENYTLSELDMGKNGERIRAILADVSLTNIALNMNNYGLWKLGESDSSLLEQMMKVTPMIKAVYLGGGLDYKFSEAELRAQINELDIISIEETTLPITIKNKTINNTVYKLNASSPVFETRADEKHNRLKRRKMNRQKDTKEGKKSKKKSVYAYTKPNKSINQKARGRRKQRKKEKRNKEISRQEALRLLIDTGYDPEEIDRVFRLDGSTKFIVYSSWLEKYQHVYYQPTLEEHKRFIRLNKRAPTIDSLKADGLWERMPKWIQENLKYGPDDIYLSIDKRVVQEYGLTREVWKRLPWSERILFASYSMRPVFNQNWRRSHEKMEVVFDVNKLVDALRRVFGSSKISIESIEEGLGLVELFVLDGERVYQRRSYAEITENHSTILQYLEKVQAERDLTVEDLQEAVKLVNIAEEEKASSPLRLTDVRSGQAVEGVSNNEQRATRDDIGGIDLNPSRLNLEIRRDGNGMPLPLNLQPTEFIQIDGFVPVIINITPVYSLPLLSRVIHENPPAQSPPNEDLHPTPIAYLDEKHLNLN